MLDHSVRLGLLLDQFEEMHQKIGREEYCDCSVIEQRKAAYKLRQEIIDEFGYEFEFGETL